MPLCRLLEAEGASTLRLPAVEIKPLGDRRALAAELATLERFDLIIFTSANAVRFGAGFLGQRRDLPLAAIGPATARALNQAGYRVAVQPMGTTDSEGLLLHPRLEHLVGHRILIIKGANGRQLLEQELTRRGAQVVLADVYEVVPASPERGDIGGDSRKIRGRRNARDHRDQFEPGRFAARAGPAWIAQRIRAGALARSGRAHRRRFARTRPEGAAAAGAVRRRSGFGG